jgi:hypothetical protein
LYSVHGKRPDGVREISPGRLAGSSDLLGHIAFLNGRPDGLMLNIGVDLVSVCSVRIFPVSLHRRKVQCAALQIVKEDVYE